MYSRLLFLLLATSLNAADFVTEKMFHLGTPGFPEWAEFEGRKPHGRELHLDFESKENTVAKTLLIRQEGVKQGWSVYLNGKRLGGLSRTYAMLDLSLELPPGRLRNGVNKLSIRPPKQVDDVMVGHIRIVDPNGPNHGHLNVDVGDLPCRITIAHPDGTLAALEANEGTASRPGVIYTGNGKARVRLLAGEYTVFASRGFEYSVDQAKVRIVGGKEQKVSLELNHEIDTRGWVAADTHIHVRDFSGHGDSTVRERMMTIAGEGVELAIATDHNHHADYRPYAKEMKVSEHFTSVIGNEVTTKGGHFNAFPIAPDTPVPNYKLTNWVDIVKGIRDTAGVKVIILNHPRNVHSGYSPVQPSEFNRETGEHRQPIDFDAMELVTSAAMQSDIMALFHDWFALLNRGHKIVGVGSSDTHDVARFAVGQSRTYVACPDDDVSKLDVNKAADSFLKGRAIISMGLLVKMRVNDRYVVGDLVPRARKLKVEVDVIGPSWTTADRLELYANGKLIGQRDLQPTDRILKSREVFHLGPLKHDAHLVAIATGPGVRQPYWETPRPYQLTSKIFNPRLIGATNPIWIDADGDGKYSPLYESKKRKHASFRKQVLTDKYHCDGITAGDINRDGKPDIVAGPYWYEGPEFTKAHAFFEPVLFPKEASPTDSMFSFVYDFNGDGWNDILKLGRVHKHQAMWFENPQGKSGRWKAHFAFHRVRGESPTLRDVDGDGKPELLNHDLKRWGFLRPRWKRPTQPWRFDPIGGTGDYNQFYHGEGIGDLNNDGRIDLMINEAIYLQPRNPLLKWKHVPARFGEKGGAQMFAYDVDADGDRDVITSLNAHLWGLAWFENDGLKFTKHMIMGTREEEPKYGVAFSQPHALELADIDGDGLQDIVTGKRMWAHGPKGDVEPNAAPVVYWFQLKREDGNIRYIPHQIDDQSGVGVQIWCADVTGDGRTDVMTASKLGAFLFVNSPAQ